MPGPTARFLGAGMALLLCLGCGGGSVAFREGRKAELHKDYDSALVHYEKAVQSEPDNPQYLVREKLVRTQASLYHLKQGRRLMSANRPDDAVGEFHKAVSIDPSNEAAGQEFSRLLAVQAAAKRTRETTLRQALKAREETSAGVGVQLKSLPAEPIAHIRISADSRKVYETLAKLANVNVAFTADFQPRPVSLDLTNEKLEDALRVVAFQTKTFWKAVTQNTILVIPDTPNNRRDYEEEVMKTVYLSNPLSAADRTAITTALKQILGLQRIIDNPDSNAIIIRDTPAKVSAAERMIRSLDRGKAEILIEVAVVEADRDRVRDLGLVPAIAPPSPSGSQLLFGYTPRATTTTGIAATPLNRLGRLSSADFSVVLPGAVASALLSDSHTRILQNPQIRTSDGQTAKLRIGSSIPYATGSFLPSFTGAAATTGGLGLLASTQFQFKDVGVNLDITPRLLPDGEVSIHASIEISSLQPSINIGGLLEPTFGQRKIEHDIRLKEGEVNLLGGLIESTVTRTVTGLPLLGQIPGLRYLFSSEHTARVETEVLVMLTPRVIRLPEPALETAQSTPAAGSVATPTPEVTPPQEPPGQRQ